MNKSALLHMIRHVSALSDQDVEELEKLAKNFPYCQTAHLLIAKASYDKGNMLSNQKLRKAAAYATNRHLLKKLIYTTDPAVPLSAVVPYAEESGVLADSPSAQNISQASINETEEVDASLITAPEHQFPRYPESATTIAALEIEPVSPETDNSEEQNANTFIPPEEIAASNKENIYEILILPEASVSFIPDPTLDNQELMEQDLPADPGEEITFLPRFEPATSLTLSELEEMLQVEKWNYAITPPDSNSPPQPVSESISIAEEPEPAQPAPAPEIIRYELEVPDELEDGSLDQTLASFDSYLFKPEADEYLNSELKPATTEEFIREVYTSNQLGYWMGSSRMGELLQVKDELTHHTPLQFYPDLILEYSKQNYLTPTDPPKASPVSRQLEIIDQFLKANPKLKAFSSEKMRSEPVDDLAFKSTKNTKSLASENLANIMVQQGKIKKAIKIYEHLIVKIPEKKAYFATQIEKLRNQI